MRRLVPLLTAALLATPALGEFRSSPQSAAPDKAALLEKSADTALAAGKKRVAFDLYLSAFEEARGDARARLLDRIVALAPWIQPAPAVPEEAEKRMVFGKQAFKGAKSAKDFADAADEFQKAADAAPWWPAAHYNLGSAQEKTGQPQQARRSYERYLQLAPKAADAKQVKTKLYELEYALKKLRAETEEWTGDWLLGRVKRHRTNRQLGDVREIDDEVDWSDDPAFYVKVSTNGEATGYVFKDLYGDGTKHMLSLKGVVTGDELPLTIDKDSYRDSKTGISSKGGSFLLYREGSAMRGQLRFFYHWYYNAKIDTDFTLEYDGPLRRKPSAAPAR